MLFNSYGFILLFLPITLLGFFYISRRFSASLTLLWMVISSLTFYAWWEPKYLALIVVSILVNFCLARQFEQGGNITAKQRSRLALKTGIVFNLGLIGFYKYSGFFIESAANLAGFEIYTQQLLLPLGISFFTFQQIGYLVDSYRNGKPERSLLRYSLFVSFFPQLIAGPIVSHKEILPQLTDAKRLFRFSKTNLCAGSTFFIIGLAKKVLIADNIAPFANSMFEAAQSTGSIDIVTSWLGMLSYTMQIYFDFSGYSDMAIGLGLLFNIRLPLNFNSPYKARSITDFWRRWHITLSHFLRDYLYIPLGGNRKGPGRRLINLMITMLLGGLWHGAGWTFVAWGALHGIYLAIHNLWRSRPSYLLAGSKRTSSVAKIAAQALTFLCVIVAWVFFRADSFSTASLVLINLFDFTHLPTSVSLLNLAQEQMLPLALVLGITFFLPNTQEFMTNAQLRVEDSIDWLNERKISKNLLTHWRPSKQWGLLIGVVVAICILSLMQPSEFLYFNF